jgi:hypothetical protein
MSETDSRTNRVDARYTVPESAGRSLTGSGIWTAPPKWMFRNITAIRENTDRILEKLESGPAPFVATLRFS